MADLQVECGYCGHMFSAPDGSEGTSIPCPACGRTTLIAKEKEEGQLSKLQLKQDSGAGELKKDCPVCGAPAEQDAVLCTQCGYNWSSGQVQSQFLGNNPLYKKLIPYVLVAIISGLIVYIVIGRTSRPASVMTAPESNTASKSNSVSIAPVLEESATEMPEALEPEAEELATAIQKEPKTDSEKETDEDDTTALDKERFTEFETRYRERLFSQLDQRQPLFEKNQDIAIRKTNGMVQRGSFLGIKDNVLVLAQENNVLEIPLKELDRASRIRCDKKFREYMVETKVKKRIQQIKEQ